jgi:uroporphyrin-III C-methyltransferase
MSWLDIVAAVVDGAPRLRRGEVWLVGAGPGDLAQLTLAGVAALIQAEAVVYDALVDPCLLALAPAAAERIFMGKRGGHPSPNQNQITAELVRLSGLGRRVVRLKGGDPFVFGRGGEEAIDLNRAGVPWRAVAGMTSGLYALMAARIPATLRGSNQALVLATGHAVDATNEPDWAAIARLGEPVVLYMAVGNWPRISQALEAGGLAPDTPAAALQEVATPREKVVISTLAGLAEAMATEGVRAPAILVVGANVAARAVMGKPAEDEPA